MRWQPIETAPLDVLVLGCAAGKTESMCVVKYTFSASGSKYASLAQTGDYAESDYPEYSITHWMPLPPPPEKTK